MRTARRPTTTAMAGRAADHPHVHHHPPPPCHLCGGVGPVSWSGLAQRLAAPGGHRHTAVSGRSHHPRWGGYTAAGPASCHRVVRHVPVGRGARRCRQESGQGWDRAGLDRVCRVVVGGQVRRGAPLPVIPHQAAAVRARTFRWACELGGEPGGTTRGEREAGRRLPSSASSLALEVSGASFAGPCRVSDHDQGRTGGGHGFRWDDAGVSWRTEARSTRELPCRYPSRVRRAVARAGDDPCLTTGESGARYAYGPRRPAVATRGGVTGGGSGAGGRPGDRRGRRPPCPRSVCVPGVSVEDTLRRVSR